MGRIAEPVRGAGIVRSIAVINQKGGTGKTTTVGNLGAALAMRGKRVLMIDFDPQGALSIWFDVTHPRSLYDLMEGGAETRKCIYKVRENLALIPGDKRLGRIREGIGAMWGGEIEERLMRSAGPYHFLLMDCPPSWSLMSRYALMIAREVYMPVSMEYLSMIGIRQVVEGVRDLVDEWGHAPEIKLVIPTFYDRRQKKSREIMKLLQWHFGIRVTEPIRSNVRLSEAISYHQSIFEYAPESHGAKDYEKLVRRVEDVQGTQSHGERPARGYSGPAGGPGEQNEIFKGRGGSPR